MSLKEFNPELADKSRVLAISKCDMLDDELREEIAAEPRKVSRQCSYRQ